IKSSRRFREKVYIDENISYKNELSVIQINERE
ncbi:unnamed protein product, partial [marine sediment metagenome]